MLPALTPELSVIGLGRSLAFYCDVLGFSRRYARPDEGFACIEMDGAVLMLDQLAVGRDWITAPLQAPLGRGMNIQIQLDDLTPLLGRLAGAAVPLFQPLERKSYQAGERTVTQLQFCVQDPDGYLLRFCQPV